MGFQSPRGLVQNVDPHWVGSVTGGSTMFVPPRDSMSTRAPKFWSTSKTTPSKLNWYFSVPATLVGKIAAPASLAGRPPSPPSLFEPPSDVEDPLVPALPVVPVPLVPEPPL